MIEHQAVEPEVVEPEPIEPEVVEPEVVEPEVVEPPVEAVEPPVEAVEPLVEAEQAPIEQPEQRSAASQRDVLPADSKRRSQRGAPPVLPPPVVVEDPALEISAAAPAPIAPSDRSGIDAGPIGDAVHRRAPVEPVPIEAPPIGPAVVDRPVVIPVPADVADEPPVGRARSGRSARTDLDRDDDLDLSLAGAEAPVWTPTRGPDEPRAIGPVPGTLRSKKKVRPGYLPGLDGLRAVSVFAVVAYHLGVLDGGFLGVDVFFVISGFLITRLLLAERERDGKVALGSFWVRRFKRLVPALLVVIVAVMVGAKFWLQPFRLGDLRGDAFAALAYVANWHFVLSGQSYFASGLSLSPLRHTWSLAIEEQYYLLWPLIVVGVMAVAKGRARRAVGLLAGVGALASAAWMVVASSIGMDLSRIYYGTDTRAFALFGGAWLASWWDRADEQAISRADRRKRSKEWSLAAVVCLVPVAVLFALGTNSKAAFYQGGFQLMTVVSLVVVAGVATGHGILSRIMANPVLVWLGRRSYGIYLWSWPTQVFATEYYRLDGAALYGAVVAVAVGLAALSYWLVEEPVRTGRRPAGFPRPWPRTDDPAIPRFVVSAVAVLAVIGLVVAISSGAPAAPANTKVTDKEAVASAVGNLSAKDEAALRRSTTTIPIDSGTPGPFGRAAPLVVPRGASADPQAAFGHPLRVLITGDSVGWSIGWDLQGRVVKTVIPDDRAIIGCGLMPQSSSFIVGSRAPEQYSPFCNKADVAELVGLSHHPDVVLLWAGAWEVYDHQVEGKRYKVFTKRYATYLEARLQARIDKYKSGNIPTVVAKLACFAPNAARLGNERLQHDRLDWFNDRLMAVAKRNRGWVRVIDPYEPLCDAKGKARPKTPDGIPLREDGSHFDPPAAVWFWNSWLAGQMGAAFDVPHAGATTSTTTVPGAPTSTTAPAGPGG